MSDGNTDTSPVGDRQITRADLEAKFSQLRGSTTATQTQRNIGLTAVIVAAVALVLAVIGVFGAMAYAVGQRMTEIGLRVTLGATRYQIISLLVRRGLAVITIGLGAGVLGAALVVIIMY